MSGAAVACGSGEGHELRDWLPRPRDDDFLSRGHPDEKPRKVRFGLMDLDFNHGSLCV
jgi:hypothetical protein